MRWTALIALTLILAVTTWPIAGQDNRRIELEIGEDTTFFTGPVRDDGTIDYIAALNAQYGEGIANQDNAYVILVQLFAEQDPDRRVEEEHHWEQTFEVLGIDPPADRVRFSNWNAFAAELGFDEREALDHYNMALAGPWSEEDYPEIGVWLEVNEDALLLLREGLEREKFFSPIVSADDDQSLLGAITPNLHHYRQIAKLLLIRFHRDVQRGDVDAAIDLVWLIDRLGYHASAEPTVIGKLVGFSCRRLAATAIAEICGRGALDQRHAIRLIRTHMRANEKQSFQDVMNHSDRCLALEQAQLLYLRLIDVRIQFLREHGGQAPEVAELFDINQSLRQMNDYYDDVLAVLREPDALARERQLEVLESEIYDSYGEPYLSQTFLLGMLQVAAGQGFPTQLFTEKLTLKLVQTLMPSVDSAERVEARVNTRRLVDCAGLALLGYRDRHGELPESLDALVPTYLDAVPADLFADAPLVYRVNDDGSALVYSVGGNFQDDGGVDDYRDGDIAIRIGPSPTQD
ncbi:MAG: hypothetical protein ACIAXF_17410 [Phycisphaerales bacterium JB063]